MKLNLTAFHFKQLLEKGYSLDQIFILKMIHEQSDISILVKENVKISALYQSLIRKGLICEKEDKLTTLGNELLIFLNTKSPERLKRKKSENDSEFEQWWNAFPSVDIFLYKGKQFSGCRTLRQNKDECRLKFEAIVAEGEYTPLMLINALKFDIMQKKEQSIKTGANKLTYLQNSLTYLRQRSHEPYIELIKEGIITTNIQEEYNGINL